MKNFPAAYTAEKNKKAGARPVWILRLTVAGFDYYLSGSAFSIGPWGVTTLPWVSRWGNVQEGITGFLEEFHIANFDCDVIIDRAASPNMETLVMQYDIEESPVRLYQWFQGCSAAPQEFFRGYVRECSLNDLIVNLSMQDETIRLERFFLGTKIDRSTYPSADPDDVGKVIPIVYGTVTKLAALAVDAGVLTTLPNGITAGATSITVSDGTGLSAGMTVMCDDEEITLSGVSGDALTVTRGVNTTVAAAHQRGAAVWQKKTEFIYLVADHAVDSIDKVFGKIGLGMLNITPICTLYPDGDHSSYPGKACVSVPGYVTIQQAVDLLVTDGISIEDAKSLVDGISVVDGVSIADGISISDLIELIDPGHYHNAALSTSESPVTQMPSPPSSLLPDGTYGISYPQHVQVDFTSEGARSSVSYSFTIKILINLNYDPNYGIWFFVNGTQYGFFRPINWQANSIIGPFSFTVAGDIRVDTVDVVSRWTGNNSFRVESASRSIQLSNNPSSSNSTGVSKFGSVDKSGTVTKSGAVTKSGTATLGGSVSKTGTVTLSGNSVANTLIAEQILVNVTRNISEPSAVSSNVLSMASFPAVTVSGTLPAGYAFNGAITEYRTALYWLNYLALQCRAFFKISCGVPRLIPRPQIVTPVKNISACRIDGEGQRQLTRRKVAFGQIINVMNLLYDRDWSRDRGADAYKGVSKGENAGSIAIHGRIENAGLFQFDFVTGSTMADDLAAFYLAVCGARPWEDEFEVFLDHSELEFGDHVTVGFLGVNGYVARAEQYPGDEGRIDIVKLTVREV